MIITVTKKQTGAEFVKDMEKEHGSIERIRKEFEKTNKMKLLVDMENWEYYQEHPDQTLELSTTIMGADRSRIYNFYLPLLLD